MMKELWEGNQAIAEAALRAGCDAYFAKPYDPMELLAKIREYLP